MPQELAPDVNSFETSLFCKRLSHLADQQHGVALKNLCNATRGLLESATAISKQIVRHLPQFTSHDEIHLWNVLSFMEQLAGGKDAIQQLGAGDCAMAVWAAFIHDLGMVLEAEELAALDAADHYDSSPGLTNKPSTLSEDSVQAWRAYRDGNEHWNAIRQAPNDATSRMKLGLVRAAFIRDSHARQDTHTNHCRIEDWLQFLAGGNLLIQQAFQDFSVTDRIVRVAVSHNQDIGWLPRQLSGLCGDDFQAEFMSAELGVIHWTWIGWLLRLADVFDCDKSRTPRILFDHSGITDGRSQTEWQKHLAIRQPPVWQAKPDGDTLLFTCQLSPSPMVEKAIHQIVGWMNDEITKVRAAWNSTTSEIRTGITLALPSQAKVEIKRREGDYLYHDMEFRLDRDAVVELLMGESLYGGPELALRELVQNALDAVHLRDQRNRLAEALDKQGGQEKARQKHQYWGGQKPEVNVTWGEEDGRRFVRVQDTGVGMNVGTMRRFLTQIGKSYYKSDDFRAEQEMMRRYGILCTAISQFGIGFLSVFMLADHVTIHTRPVGADEAPPPATKPELQETARFPFRAEIHGPHGLLAFYPDSSVKLPGTTITIWLKDQFVFPKWNRRLLIGRLQKEFYGLDLGSELEEEIDVDIEEDDVDELVEQQIQPLKTPLQLLDPAFEIGRFIVWPLYPVKLASIEDDPVVLDAAFHYRELVPLDQSQLRDQAAQWGHDIPEIAHTAWQVCDWEDQRSTTKGVEGTGSRIRLIGPQFNRTPHTTATPDDWAAISEYLPSGQPTLLLSSFAEAQLPDVMTRYQCLVNGVRIVPGLVAGQNERDCKLPQILTALPILPGMGGWVWIDLRGEAMPRLRADRSAPVASQPSTLDLLGLLQRWVAAWPNHLPNWLSSLTDCREMTRPMPAAAKGPIRVGLNSIDSELANDLYKNERHLISKGVESLPEFKRPFDARDFKLDSDLYIERPYKHDEDEDNDALALDQAINHVRVRVRVHAHTRDLAIDLTHDINHGLIHDFAHGNEKTSRQYKLWASVFRTHFASEGLWPDLPHSHPALGMTGLSATLSELTLAGPNQVILGNTSIRQPDWLDAFDLSAPYTAFAMPGLSRRFPNWLTERVWRTLLMLPFLFGQEPSPRWRKSLSDREMFDKIRKLLIFIPDPHHQEWLFAEHTRDEWAQGSASALWDLTTGEVLYADGIHTEQSIRAEGKSLEKWIPRKRQAR